MWLVNFAYSISTNYSMGIEMLMTHGEKEMCTESKWWEATSEPRKRPGRKGWLCSDFSGAIFARDYKKIPRTMLFPIISCRYLSGSETGMKGSGQLPEYDRK